MKIRKVIAALLAALLIVSATGALADVTIAVPNDPTNEARALQLLVDNGIIELAEGAGELATKADVVTEGIEIVEVQADLVVNQLPDVDYAVINSNFVVDARDAGIEIPAPLLIEGEAAYMARANIIAVHSDNVDADLTKALVAAATSQQVKDYIDATYDGAIIATVEEPTDGYDADVDYDALAGSKIIIAASPAPHAQILEIVKDILAEKDIELEIVLFTGYTEENPMVDAGDAYANYFQHKPYLDQEVAENGYQVEAVAYVHTEPMGLYAGRQSDLSALGK